MVGFQPAIRSTKSTTSGSQQNRGLPSFTTTFYDSIGRKSVDLKGVTTVVRIVQTFENPDPQFRNRWANAVLEAVAESWPQGLRARYVITAGGFISFEWPQHLVVRIPSRPKPKEVKELTQYAAIACEDFLTLSLRRKLGRVSDFVSLGADSKSENEDRSAELVVLLDLHSSRKWVTGKSYPIGRQESVLVRINDLSTHQIEIGSNRVLLLGCHDLNMFSNRSRRNAKGWRAKQIREMRRLTSNFVPTVALQHPHYTQSPHSWGTALGGLRALTVRAGVENFTFAGAGRWCNPDGKSLRPLDRCLRATADGNVVTAVVRRAR
jgi:hypothetical protein